MAAAKKAQRRGGEYAALMQAEIIVSMYFILLFLIFA